MLRTVLGCGIFLQTVNKYEWSLYPIVLSVNDIKLMHRNSYSSFFSMLSIVTSPFERNILKRTRNNQQRKKNGQANRIDIYNHVNVMYYTQHLLWCLQLIKTRELYDNVRLQWILSWAVWLERVPIKSRWNTASAMQMGATLRPTRTFP